MSYAQNFLFGAKAAENILNAYYNAREQSQLRKIAEAQPRLIENAYTQQDAEQLHAIANARDAEGRPYYSLEANPDGSYGLRANFSYQKPDGQVVQPGDLVTTISPRPVVVEFLGNRYAPEELTEDRILGLRARAMANVIAQRDPARGLQMLKNIAAMERDNERFKWEKELHPLRLRASEIDIEAKRRAMQREDELHPLQLRALEAKTEAERLALEQARNAWAREEAIRNAYSQAFKLPQDELVKLIGRINLSNLPFIITKQDKNGFVVLSLNDFGVPTGPEIRLSEFQMRHLLAAHILAEQGYGDESMKILKLVDEDIAKRIKDWNEIALDFARVVGQNAYQRGRLEQDARELAFKQQAAMRRASAEISKQKRLEELANKVGGLRRAYELAKARGNIAEAQKYLAELNALNNQLNVYGIRLKDMPPSFNPKDYATVLKILTDARGDPTLAQIQTDQIFGLHSNLDAIRKLMEYNNLKAQQAKPQK